jgi:hypothetical protein
LLIWRPSKKLLLLRILLLVGEEGIDGKLSSCQFLPFYARRRRL